MKLGGRRNELNIKAVSLKYPDSGMERRFNGSPEYKGIHTISGDE